MRKVLFLALGLLLVAPAAHAGGWFVGGSLLQAGVEEDFSGFDDDDSGLKVFGGYNFNQYFGIEGAYSDLGEAEDVGIGIETTALSAFATGTLPLGERFELFAKAGFYMWDAELSMTGVPGTLDEDDTEFAYGAGAKLKLGDKAAIRLEYELFEIDADGTDIDVDILSAGFEFRFGGN